MKKVAAAFLLVIISTLWLSGCSNTAQKAAKELKEEIPTLKMLLTENLEVFTGAHRVFCRERPVSFGLSSEEDGQIKLWVGKKDQGGLQEGEAFSETTLFSDEEKESILNLFQISQDGVRVRGLNAGQYMIEYRDLVDLRLIYTPEESEAAIWEERAYYFEELADGWYAYIIISKPGIP